MSLISIVSRLMGFVREQVIASHFGVSAITDAYVSAQFLPSFVDVVVGGAIAFVLVPLFTSAQSKGKAELGRFLGTALVFLGVVYGFETLLLILGAPLILSVMVPGLDSEAKSLGIALARIFAPMVLLVGLYSLHSALLNVNRRFIIAGLGAVAANFGIVIAAMTYGERVTVQHLAWASVIGNVIQLMMVLAEIRLLKVTYQFDTLDWAAIRSIVVLGLPLVAANSITQLGPAVDKFFASHMTEGSIGALNYAFKLVQLPVGVLILGFSTVAYARFAKLSEQGNKGELEVEVGRALQGLLFVMLPVTALVIALSNAGVSVAFKRGHFDGTAVRLTSDALVAYSVGLIPMAVLPLLGRVLFSLKNTRTQLYAGICSFGVYILVALVFAPILSHTGLALAFAFGQLASSLVLSAEVWRSLGQRPFRIMVRSLHVSILGSLLCAGSAWGAVHLFRGALSQLSVGLVGGAVVYLGVHVVFSSEEAGWIRLGARAILRTRSPRHAGGGHHESERSTL